MYEVLSTAIHFRTPPGVLDVPEDEPAPPAEGSQDSEEVFADTGDFFSGLAHGLGELIGGVLDGIDHTLTTATVLIEAASELVHQLHDLATLSE